jgi:hypothetical protein
MPPLRHECWLGHDEQELALPCEKVLPPLEDVHFMATAAGSGLLRAPDWGRGRGGGCIGGGGGGRVSECIGGGGECAMECNGNAGRLQQ